MPVGQCMIFSCYLKKMPDGVFLQKCQPHLLITVAICSDILHGAGGNSFTRRYLVHHICCAGNLVAQWALVCCRWVWQSPNGRHDRNIWVFVQLLEKQHDCANICLKKNNMCLINFSNMCHRTCFWLFLLQLQPQTSTAEGVSSQLRIELDITEESPNGL